jgi:hypothetical protein
MLSCGKQYTMYITTEVYEMIESLFDSVSYWYRPTIRNLACGTDVETLFGVYDSKDSLEWWGINVTANYQNTTYISNLDFFNSTDSSGGQDT